MRGQVLAAAIASIALSVPAGAAEPAGEPAPAAVAPPGEDAGPEEGRRRENALRHLLDTLEVVDTPVYSRNMLQLKYEWTARPAGAAMAQIMFKPVFAWGERREFVVRVEVPVETVYPSPSSGLPTSSGFASLTTTFLWAFWSEHGLRQAGASSSSGTPPASPRWGSPGSSSRSTASATGSPTGWVPRWR